MPKKSFREAKTERGETVIAKVENAAKRLLKDRWLNDISVSALAKEAGVVRASLFFQFERGWPDVAAFLAERVLFEKFDRILTTRLREPSSDEPLQTIVRALHSFVDLAEQSGRLVPNLRAQMFVWGPENNALFHLPSQDFYEELADVLAMAVRPKTEWHHDAAEMLINFALDMAGGAGMHPWSVQERRDLISRQVKITVSGLEAITDRGTE